MSDPTPEPAPVAAPAEPSPAPPAVAPEVPKPQAPADSVPEQQPAATTEELPPWAQRELKKLRDEAAGNRVKAKETADALAQFRTEQDQQRHAMAKAMGLVSDEPPTPEQLTDQLNAARAEHAAEQGRARQAAVELAVHRAAVAQQVDANALLDSRTVASALEGLDPTATDFSQKVAELISVQVEQQPRYKLTPPEPVAPVPPTPPVVPKSGAEFGAAPSGPRQWTEEDVARSAPSDLQKAINEGLLENLGFGPRRASRR